uniref:Integrase catalytic domain-containing protein n=1 Tax=Nicotiana tabacum TaxID=4097 RepID=A0A1S4B377_TOBAC|nr:PREDICTED: uncharacterized protein LOC107803999 [Nicotiana tabacum]
MVVVFDLKETIEGLSNEKHSLEGKITTNKEERDDLLVICTDLEETIEELNREHRNDLLVICPDLEETIEELKREHRNVSLGKGKEVASEIHIMLEKELTVVKTSLCSELEKNQQLQVELEKVRIDLEKSLKWTWFSDVVTAMYLNNSGNRQESSERKQIAMDYGCLKHVTENIMNFLSLKAMLEGNEPGTLLTTTKAEEIVEMQLMTPFKQQNTECGKSNSSKSPLSIKLQSQTGNTKAPIFTNLVTGEVVLVAKRYKNIYVADFESLKNGDLNCLSDVNDDAKLWHRRLGHTSFTLLNKLVRNDPVRGLSKSRFKDHKVCDTCVKGKQVRSSFKPKNEVNTSRPLDLLHMDLCGPMMVASRGGKKYIFVIVDDYSRFTHTLFLRTKDETFEVFVSFVKKIQVKMGNKVACIRSDHGTEFDHVKFDEFCTENGITHNFSAPRTPQQNGVVERKNRTIKDMARTMLIDHGNAKYFWAEADNTACYLVNKCMIRSLLNKTPYELLNGRKSKLTHLRTFGCKCFVLNNGKEALGKYDAKTHLSCEKNIRIDQDGEPLFVLGEVIDMENGKANMMSHVKESSEDDANTSLSIREKPGPQLQQLKLKTEFLVQSRVLHF